MPSNIILASEETLNDTDLRILRSDDQGIQVSLSFPDYSISEVNNGEDIKYEITVPGTYSCQAAGDPVLPVKRIVLGVPPQADIQMITEIDGSVAIPGSYNLIHSPYQFPIENNLEPGLFQSGVKYNPSGELQENRCITDVPARIADEAWIRDQRIILVEAFPFLYRPENGELTWHKNVEIDIQFTYPNGDHETYVSLSNSTHNPFEVVLESSILNYETARDWRGYSRDQLHKYQTSFSGEEEGINTGDSTELYKIGIQKDGFYKLTYETLSSAGLPVDELDPTTFKLTNQGDEVAIYVHNLDLQNDFTPGEYLIFYGEEFSGEKIASMYPDEDEHWISYPYNDGTGRVWAPEFNADMVEKYTDTNIYWLAHGGGSGKRMTVETESSDGTVRENYRTSARAESSEIWRTYLFAGEDTWYWEKIQVIGNLTSTYSITLSTPDQSGDTAVLRGELVAENYDISNSPDHKIIGYLNDLQQSDPIFTSTWDGKGRFAFEGEITATRLNEGENRFDLVTENLYGNAENLYFDWLEIEYDRNFVAEHNQIWFPAKSVGQISTYEVTGFNGVGVDDIWVFDITDELNPKLHTGGMLSGDQFTYSFLDPDDGLFFIGVVNELTGSDIEAYAPQELATPADYIFITHKEFLTETHRLASYRESQGLSSLVVEIDKIINEFNFGIYHPIAIKNFLAYTFDPNNWSSPPSYTLLIGDGHWNFLEYPSYDAPPNLMPPNLSWVDPWQGEVDSANLLATVVNPEDTPDPMADLIIGRLPVNSTDEMKSVVDKIISYESLEIDDWERNVFFVADDSDGSGNFSGSADSLVSDLQDHGVIPYRIYYENFLSQDNCTPDGSRQCPELSSYLMNSLEEDGALFLNYYGHGWIYRWASESLFTNDDASKLENKKFPIIFSATCLDGYWIHPNSVINSYNGSSLIEEMIRVDKSGAIAAFSPTGLGLATGHDYLLQGFYDAFYENDVNVLGLMGLNAKMRLWETQIYKDLLHTYTIFGDPALSLPPVNNISTPDRTYLPFVTAR